MHNAAYVGKDSIAVLKAKITARLLLVGLTLGVIGTISLSAGVIAAYHYTKPSLPEAATVKDIPLQVPLRVYSRDGRLIREIGEQRRLLVSFDEIPDFVVQAFLAAEDDRFFTHPGIDYQGVLRAAWKNIVSGRRAQGASTLTQQLARDYFLSRERSFVRKIREIFLSYKIEQEFSKEEIMEMFLNKMFFGQRAYGVAAAAQVYFGKTLHELHVAEAATLAGTLQRPSNYNPVSGPENAKRRRTYVLRRMRELGYIDDAQWQEAMDYPMVSRLHGPDIELSAPYVAEMVRAHLINEYGRDVTSKGFRVYTSVDADLQRAANYAVRDGLLEYDRRHGFRGALSTLDIAAATDAQIEQVLSDYAEPGGLQTAIVMSINDTAMRASVRLKGARVESLPFSGVAWAARFINNDVIGDAPEKISDVLQPGDVIYVIETVSDSLALAQIPQTQGSLVALDPNDGAISALVGGFDYTASKFNRATQARRQPGSSFKPFVYSAALENGFTTASIINDAPVVIESSEYEGVWRPKNSTGRFYGPTRMREALVRSMNLVSVRMVLKMGVGSALRHIQKFGLPEEAMPRNLSLALGSGAATPVDMASAYAVIANGGFAVKPYYIDRIENADGEVLFQANPAAVCRACDDPSFAAFSEPADVQDLSNVASDVPTGDQLTAFWGEQDVAPRVVDADNIWLVQDMLRDAVRRGTGRRAMALGRTDLAGKTGTSNDQRDAWFAGFNPDLVAIAWVGFDSDQPLGRGEEGGRTALPVWVHFMHDALAGAPNRRAPQPPGLVTVRISPSTGELAGARDSNFVFETFRLGTQPQRSVTPTPDNPYNNDETRLDIDEVF